MKAAYFISSVAYFKLYYERSLTKSLDQEMYDDVVRKCFARKHWLQNKSSTEINCICIKIVNRTDSATRVNEFFSFFFLIRHG